MSDGQGVILFAPTAADCVDVAGADAATLNLDIDIVVTEWLWLKLVLVKLCPRLWSEDLKTGELIRVGHAGDRGCGGVDWMRHGGRADDGEGKKSADGPLNYAGPLICSRLGWGRYYQGGARAGYIDAP